MIQPEHVWHFVQMVECPRCRKKYSMVDWQDRATCRQCGGVLNSVRASESGTKALPKKAVIRIFGDTADWPSVTPVGRHL
jgi:uncharacterized protein with PIN domain